MAIKQISGLHDLDFMFSEIGSYPIPTELQVQESLETLHSILAKETELNEVKSLAKRLLREFDDTEIFVTTSSDATIVPKATPVPIAQSSYEEEVQFNAAFIMEILHGEKALEPDNFSITGEDKLKYWYQCYQSFMRWRNYENDNKFFSK